MNFSLHAEFAGAQVVPVLEFSNVAQVIPVLDILSEHQFNLVEITLRHALAKDALALALKNYAHLSIGVGSVTSRIALTQCIAMQPAFAVSPGLTLNILKEAQSAHFPLLPGVSTASEIMQGLECNIDCFKFFPAESAGGVQALKSFSGPFKEVQFCPTGGIRLENLHHYLALPNVFCVGASWFVSAQDLAEQNWEKIRRLTKQVRASLA